MLVAESVLLSRVGATVKTTPHTPPAPHNLTQSSQSYEVETILSSFYGL